MTDTTLLGPTPSVGAANFQALVDRDYHTMPYANSSGSDIAAGDVVVVNGLPGLAIGNIDDGQSGTLLILTVCNVVKKYEAISQGAKVYWDTTGDPYGGTAGTGAATGTAASHYYMGKALVGALIGDARVKVYLMPMAAGPDAFGYSDSANLLDGGTAQGTRAQSATQNYPLGMARRYADGRVFRYVKARTALEPEFGAGYAAKTITNAVAPTQDSGAGTSGDSKVTITVGASDGLAANGAVAADELVGGYVVIGNGTNQHPQNRRITANTVVAAGGGACTLTLDEALDQSVTPSTTNIETLMNPWILSDMYVTNSAYVTARGMPARRLTINNYGFVQTAGPCWITSDGNTCDSAGDRQIYFVANGSCVSGNDVTGDVNVQQLAGHAIDMSGSGASNAPFVNLDLEVC